MVRGTGIVVVLASFFTMGGSSLSWNPTGATDRPSQGSAGAVLAQGKGPDAAVTRASELVRRWRVVIGTVFEERRASAMEPIMDEIEIVISPAAVKAAQDRANTQQLNAADMLMQRFALAMVAAGERLADGSVHIGEEAIDTGLAKVCPAYPLCPQ